MSTVAMNEVKTGNAEPRRGSLPARLWKGLRSLRFAIVLMALIAVACIVGTLVKQEPYDPQQAMQHYGKALGLLVGLLGLNHLYGTWWFVGLLGLFALSTAACALSRCSLRLRCLGSMAVHLSILFILAGAILRGLFGVDGAVVLQEGQTVSTFETDAGKMPLGFQLRLDDFDLRRHGQDADVLLVRADEGAAPQRIPVEVGRTVRLEHCNLTLQVLRYLPHFMMNGGEVYSASDRPVNPAVQVLLAGPSGEMRRWLFARFPDLHGHGEGDGGPQVRYVRQPAPVKAFESRVTVLSPEGQELRRASVLVNSPLKAGRYTLYQLSYDPETEASSTLEVVHDPGVPLVFTGFALMPLGIAFVFYVQPLLKRRTRADA